MINIKREYIHLIGGVSIIVIIFGGFFLYTSKKVNAPEEVTTVKDGGIGATVSGDSEINQIPVDVTLPLPTGAEVTPPSLSRTLSFPSGFPADAIAIIENNVATLTAELKNNPDSFSSWMDLAQQYKIIEDYAGARDIWEYLTKVYSSATPYINLGNLYALDMQDFIKAEANFKKAIKVDATQVESYKGLYELYRYSYKTDTNLAEQALLDALTAVPHDIDVLITLATYYKDTNRLGTAKARYIEARNEAEKLGNTGLVAVLDKEIAGL